MTTVARCKGGWGALLATITPSPRPRLRLVHVELCEPSRGRRVVPGLVQGEADVAQTTPDWDRR